jgi:cytoskeletal protein RodZ
MKTKHLGFSVVEVIFGLVLVAVIVGIGYSISHKHNAATNSTASSNSVTLDKNASAASDVQSITNSLNQQSSSEASVEAQSNSSDQAAATSVNSANSSLGGAYNEASF